MRLHNGWIHVAPRRHLWKPRWGRCWMKCVWYMKLEEAKGLIPGDALSYLLCQQPLLLIKAMTAPTTTSYIYNQFYKFSLFINLLLFLSSFFRTWFAFFCLNSFIFHNNLYCIISEGSLLTVLSFRSTCLQLLLYFP